MKKLTCLLLALCMQLIFSQSAVAQDEKNRFGASALGR